MSTAEAEYTAATEAGKYIRWVLSLLSFMQIKPTLPVPLYEDNAACRTMATSIQVSGRNKHFELRQHFVRQLVKDGIVALHAIATSEQIADVFTKPLPRPVFEKFATALLDGLPTKFLPAAGSEGGS